MDNGRWFKKLLVANRGEIAVRIIRACRELGIPTVALYEPAEIGSLHVRLADECAVLNSSAGFLDAQRILQIAMEKGADAIHPGYGFLAEQPGFIRLCEEADIHFIGPPSTIMEAVTRKLEVLQRAREAGFPTAPFSPVSFAEDDLSTLLQEAERLGYPVVIKSCSGGRGPGERLVHKPEAMVPALRSARNETQAFFQSNRIYVEKAIRPVYEIGAQVLCDRQGNGLYLGECQVLVQHGNRRVVAECPAPLLSSGQRVLLRDIALDLARLLGYENAGTVEFLLDEQGQFYFTELKARLQLEHPLIELVSGVDLVHAQLRLAAGEPLPLQPQAHPPRGSALLGRINAEDPWNSFLPSPGTAQQVRLPGGPGVRVDTSIDHGSPVPGNYDPLIAKLAVWGEERTVCLERFRRALEEFQLAGLATNLSLLYNILSTPEFEQGRYSTDFHPRPQIAEPDLVPNRRDLAVAMAAIYLLREQCLQTPPPDYPGASAWQRNVRIPPQWKYTGLAHEKNGSDH